MAVPLSCFESGRTLPVPSTAFNVNALRPSAALKVYVRWMRTPWAVFF
jgi:hypothetical protein